MRGCGVLLHISSLPGSCGIGSFGWEAYKFVDFLSRANQCCWQILPMGPTSYGDSPYQSLSAFAGNPYYIDLELLCRRGLLHRDDLDKVDWGKNPVSVSFGKIFKNRYKLLYKAFIKGFPQDFGEVGIFRQKQRNWLEEYALFMAIKNCYGLKPWWQWPKELAQRNPEALARFAKSHRTDMDFWVYVQYLFYSQWASVKRYANQRGIEIMGDIPIYVARDSAETWANPQLFQLEPDGTPTRQAGVPPDYFSADGQLWGNPLYNWEELKAQDYSWWVDRMRNALELYDRVRIDHFRGFEAYYSIPFGAETARHGRWEKGPGMDLFKVLRRELGEGLPIVAEDLGSMTPGVRKLLKDSGFPGMKVMQFGFDPKGDSEHLPGNIPKHCVAYVGTHDNDTLRGWLETAPRPETAFARRYLRTGLLGDPVWSFIRGAYGCPADLVMVQMQDLLGLGTEARMNTPATLGGNWKWRMKDDDACDALSDKMRHLAQLYRR